MVAYLLDFHESIRFSKTLGEYREQPYPIAQLAHDVVTTLGLGCILVVTSDKVVTTTKN